MNSSRNYLIGLGPPRSGTTSLAALLDGCDGAHVTHEAAPCLPWDVGPKHIGRALGFLEARTEAPVVGDVGYYWLPYVMTVWRHLAPQVRFVALLREPEAWHESFAGRINPSVLSDNQTQSRSQFPCYDGTPREQRGKYYITYRRRLEALQAEGVPLSIRRTSALNAPRRILRASGIPREQWNPQAHHKNQR
jgi:hypothetical protein